MSQHLSGSSSDSIELLSTQGSNALNNVLIKNTKLVTKVFDKEVKTYVVCIEGSSFHTTNIEIPKLNTTTLQIMHRYLVIQCMIGTIFQVEFHIRDKKQIKKRIIISSSFKTITKTQLHSQIPLPENIIAGQWMNLCFDLFELVEISFNDKEEYYCLDRICIGPSCTIRKVFTLKHNPETEVLIPKKLAFSHTGDNNVCIVDSSSFLSEEEISALKKKPPVITEKPASAKDKKPQIAFGRRIFRPTTGLPEHSILQENSVLLEPKPHTAGPRIGQNIHKPSTSATNKTGPIIRPRKPQPPQPEKQKSKNILLISHNKNNETTISRYSEGDEEEIEEHSTESHNSIEELRILKKPPKEEYNPNHYQTEEDNLDLLVISEQEIEKLNNDPLIEFTNSRKKIALMGNSISDMDKSLTSARSSKSSLSTDSLCVPQRREALTEALQEVEVNFGDPQFSDNEEDSDVACQGNDSFGSETAIHTLNSYKFKEDRKYNPTMFEDEDLVLLEGEQNINCKTAHDSLIEKHTVLESTNSALSSPTPNRICTVNVGMDEYIEEPNSRRMFHNFEEDDEETTQF
ncbi:hypothetical protein FDP41_006476 [Naegleria fowleri]|uniref:CFA20 domain-containing protein n=1 Tax=Naegleria fowleri TaxID=5763 RepID=A0A6A5BJ11_NAEFO|nr:uncharacterized protein FDP41_006973 [Naegleria fowleri]XP_044559157.1 uncharacterized protein FDP41_006476 [Naegleria fowleri]KAF0973990.1 hypothetical protein FDP41_006973 [Naegleria fowleri]KAF0974444.1 hypothetical protein FDP41_006476 [Naegleria fowleri]CAG4710572.1 unnamed protein product [Naegleria fowleri]